MDRLNEETNQKVKKLSALLSQRAQIDAEISKLREEINALIVEPERVASSESSIATSSAVATPPPYKPATPPPYIPKPNPPAPPAKSDNLHSADERNIGVRWMAVAGVSIAVLGLIICIKIMLDRELIGPVGRVIIGYLVSAGVVAAAILKVPEKRRVLKDMLVFGGSFLAYGDTCLAYGYFDLFPSSVTIVVLWFIAIGLIAYAWVRDNKLLFNVALFTFVMSPFFAGYAMGHSVNKTIFWMSFTVIFNALLFVVYKIKKWSSPLVTAFFATFMIFVIKLLDGASMSRWVNASFFTLCCGMFYAATVLLHRIKENFNSQFVSFNICNFALYIICVSIELSYKTPISYSFLSVSLMLFLAAFLMRKLMTDSSYYYNATYSFSIFFLNLAFIIGFMPRGAQWFPVVYAVEILVMLLVYKTTALEYYKQLCCVLIYSSFALIFCYTVWMEGGYINRYSFWIVINIPCIAKMIYAAVLVYALSQIDGKHNHVISFILFAVLFMIVAIEVYRYWNYIDATYDSDIQRIFTQIVMSIGIVTLSYLLSIIPEKIAFLATLQRIGFVALQLSLVVFVILIIGATIPKLYGYLRLTNYHAWRYGVLAFYAVALALAYRLRKKAAFQGINSITYIVVMLAAFMAVVFEIRDFNINVFIVPDQDCGSMVVFNISFLAKMVYVAVLFLVLHGVKESGRVAVTVLLFVTLFIAVGSEILSYRYFLAVEHASSITIIMVMWWLLVLSFLFAIVPEKVDYLSACSKIGHIFILVGIAVFSVVVHYYLVKIRTEDFTVNYAAWRYVSLALLTAASVYAVRSRNCQLCSNWNVITDIVVSCVAIVAVSSEINNIIALVSGEDNSYGLWLSAWYGVASLVLFLVGFRYQLKHLRILGFVVAGVTVCKIIFYDMWNHQLWVKAVVFVAVGICFILVSYFYTKHLKK